MDYFHGGKNDQIQIRTSYQLGAVMHHVSFAHRRKKTKQEEDTEVEEGEEEHEDHPSK